MKQHEIFPWILIIIIECKANIDSTLPSNLPSDIAYGTSLKNFVDPLMQTSTAGFNTALDSVANLLKTGSNFIIDASSLGGGILFNRKGYGLSQLPQNSATDMTNKNSLLLKLLENISVPLPQLQSNSVLANPQIHQFSHLQPSVANQKFQSFHMKTAQRPRHIIPRPSASPFNKNVFMTRKYLPYSRYYINALLSKVPNAISMKILETASIDDEDD